MLLASALPVLLLIPFLGKAFHIDDPLFLYTAQHILDDPLDFYGFPVNWYATAMPMHEVNQNPPLLAYYLAPFGALFGWHGQALLGRGWGPGEARRGQATAGAERRAWLGRATR